MVSVVFYMGMEAGYSTSNTRNHSETPMEKLNAHLLAHPLVSTFIIVAVCLALVLGLPLLFPTDSASALTAKVGLRLLISCLLIYLITRLGWTAGAGIKGNRLRRGWWLASLPMLLIVAINAAGTDFSALRFTPSSTLAWTSMNVSVGLFEEIMLRGFCFYLLWQAWQDRKNGLLMAAMTQAVIFGLLHLINLAHSPVLDTVSQTIYATLFGIGFAGLTAYCRSIWPSVMIHTAINLAGSLGDLIPGSEDTGGTLQLYITAIIVITLVSAMPGLWLLRKARQQMVVA